MSALGFHEMLMRLRVATAPQRVAEQAAPVAPEAEPMPTAAPTAAPVDDDWERVEEDYSGYTTGNPFSKKPHSPTPTACCDYDGCEHTPVAEPAPVAEPVAEPCSPEEAQVLRWFRESNALAQDAIQVADQDEEYEWIDMPTQDAHTVEITQERLRAIGLVMTDGSTPTNEDPAKLYWVQDKPADMKGKFGAWDPVNAQWRVYTKRDVTPVEQRIAPVGVYDDATFKASDYGDQSKYEKTALAAGLPHILAQMSALAADAEVPVVSGWGGDAAQKTLFYTPHLRHLEIDASIQEGAGKKYVYRFADDNPVKPVYGKAVWNSTNSCWVYPVDAGGAIMVEQPTEGQCCEHSRDHVMKGR